MSLSSENCYFANILTEFNGVNCYFRRNRSERLSFIKKKQKHMCHLGSKAVDLLNIFD